MARKSLEQRHRGFNTGAVASVVTPTTCPVCGEMPVVAKGEKLHQVLESHIMAKHRPDALCPHEHRADVKLQWKLDWNAVVYAQPSPWYCSECGFYLKA